MENEGKEDPFGWLVVGCVSQEGNIKRQKMGKHDWNVRHRTPRPVRGVATTGWMREEERAGPTERGRDRRREGGREDVPCCR